MSESGFAQFQKIDQEVKANQNLAEQKEAELLKIDFTKFSAQEMEVVADADWISDATAVKIMNDWKLESDKTLLELRANALLSSTFDSKKLQAFIDATFTPSNKPDLIIKNIFNNMATASGTRPFVNPLVGHLISCSNREKILKDETANLFDGNLDTSFTANPSREEFLLIRLPPFLRLKLTSYTIGSPKSSGGLKEWTIFGTNDEVKYTVIHQVKDDTHLSVHGVTHNYTISNPPDEFFNAFKIVTASNHSSNLSFIASTLDFDGIVTLFPYKVLK